MTAKKFILDFDFDELKILLNSWGEPAYRTLQIWQGLYRQFYEKPDQFTNLPLELRHKLSTEFDFSKLSSIGILNSSDGNTVKSLFRLPDQNAIEAVLMKYDQRKTLCISSQAGCALGCVFCATGQMGFKRNLTSGEIIEQVISYSRQLIARGESVTNIVIMGMGEPFLNYDAVTKAIDCLNHPEGYNLGSRRFTISTAGIIPAIYRFAEEKRQINLAISLHFVDDDSRSAMMPINRKYPIKDLLAACHNYCSTTNRRITFEWALIEGVNDTPQIAHALADLLHGLLCHINLIPLNPTYAYHGKGSGKDRMADFKFTLNQAGIPCSIRTRRGIEIQAGCGQLAYKNKND